MKLLGDNIAVKMDDTQSAAAGSLVPQNEDQARTGEVIIVGPGEIYEGERQPLNYKGSKIKIVDEDSVMAILEEGDEA